MCPSALGQHFRWLLQHSSSKNSAGVGKLVPPQRTLPRMQPRQERLEQLHVRLLGQGFSPSSLWFRASLTHTSPLGLTSPLMPISPLLATSLSLSQSSFQSHQLQKGIFVKFYQKSFIVLCIYLAALVLVLACLFFHPTVRFSQQWM